MKRWKRERGPSQAQRRDSRIKVLEIARDVLIDAHNTEPTVTDIWKYASEIEGEFY